MEAGLRERKASRFGTDRKGDGGFRRTTIRIDEESLFWLRSIPFPYLAVTQDTDTSVSTEPSHPA